MKFPRILTLTAFILSLIPLLHAAEDPSLPSYVGPQQCPYRSDISGYTNSTTLHYDMIHDARAFTQIMDTLPDEEKQMDHVYVICPETTIDLGSDLEKKGEDQSVHPLIPLLSHTVIKCGYEGRLEDRCLIVGGLTQVHFFDFLITEYVLFEGLTFAKNEGVSIYASGNTYSSTTFKNCLIEEHKGFNAIQIYFDGNINNNRRLSDDTNLVRKYDYNSGVNKSIYTDLVSSVTSIYPGVKDILEISESYEDMGRDRKLGTFAEGMIVTLFGTDVIDNIQDKAVVMNIAGTLEVIDSDISYNEVGFATITTILGGRLFMHTNTYLEYNRDKTGPVFIDKNSFLYLNKDVTGKNNVGSACDIFFEEPESTCISEGEPCQGTCCTFGDDSCDVMTVAPSATPPPGGDGTQMSSFRSFTAGGEEQQGPTCDALCISLSCVIPLVVLGLGFLVWRRKRTRIEGQSREIATVTEETDLDLEPTPNEKAVSA